VLDAVGRKYAARLPLIMPRKITDTKIRCDWALSDPLELDYHDREWGVPVYDDRVLFEFLTLEGAQAGLSWTTILRKRDAYRRAFASFDPSKVARFDASRKRRLLQDPGIVRNAHKIDSAIGNARALLKVREEFGSFRAYVWQFVDGAPRRNAGGPCARSRPKRRSRGA
jgi:DNA-3-methyladenine glycosylase I